MGELITTTPHFKVFFRRAALLSSLPLGSRDKQGLKLETAGRRTRGWRTGEESDVQRCRFVRCDRFYPGRFQLWEGIWIPDLSFTRCAAQPATNPVITCAAQI